METIKVMKSQFYIDWDSYKLSNPSVSDLDDVCNVVDYEEQMYRFVISLFM